jgi:hypothetical protein
VEETTLACRATKTFCLSLRNCVGKTLLYYVSTSDKQIVFEKMLRCKIFFVLQLFYNISGFKDKALLNYKRSLT